VILAIIVAMDESGVIGRGGGLPWHLPDDLRRFKATTTGHVLLMGRRTCESIGRALPGRRSIVLTRHPGFRAPDGVEVAPDLETALSRAADAPRVYVIGGAAVYREALPHAQELLVTQVHARVAGDVWFPAVSWDSWTLVDEELHPADARHPFPFSFRRFVRRV
jgi:dihydrofolate reductase